MGATRSWRTGPPVWQRAVLGLSVFLSGLLAIGLWVAAIWTLVRIVRGDDVSMVVAAVVGVAAVVATWLASRVADARDR